MYTFEEKDSESIRKEIRERLCEVWGIQPPLYDKRIKPDNYKRVFNTKWSY